MKPIQEILPVNISNKERIISDGIGAALIVMGLLNIKQPSVKTFLELGGGVFLFFRGTTGYCPTNGNSRTFISQIESQHAGIFCK